MKTAKFFTVTLVLLSLVNFSFGQGKKKANTPTLNKDNFEGSLIASLAPNVKGYQFVLIKDGNIVSSRFGGAARNSKDGSMSMKETTPQNIGSLQKFITGTAMLNLMVHPWAESVDEGKTLKQRLDRKFITLFPTDWYKNVTPGVANISIRQLLQHRSGFDMQKGDDRTALGYLRDSNGYDQAKYNKYEYANINYVLTGYLMQLYYKRGTQGQMGNNITYNKMSDADANKYVLDYLGKTMHQLMKQRIWDKMTPKFSPSCDAKNELKNTVAFAYTSKQDAEPGIVASQIEKKGHCSGEGGYYMSARDLANYVAHFGSTDLIVNKEARDLMYSENIDVNDRMVWALATKDDWMKEKFNMQYVAWSNGVPSGNRSVILRLPQNYYLVIVNNSPDLDVGDLYGAGVKAFKDGMKHNFD